ncbi:DNA primase [Streptomyces sp. BA2]|uniref:DNA primase n=1 Tax=Streptomyces sp. BA2 TaxID=436595 RepID=UPI00132B6CD6|nr:DNA primase [Streptomyces sp. BA2]MWA15418.1 DNA primase [Streptomyces sp. BA2]
MNRLGLGLAVGAGYVLGRTKKMKFAFAVGTMVAGKRMNLSPRALGDLLSQQLQNNPQFKEIGDQLREDMRGVGKAATGALVERQISGLADRLHGRTADVRDQLAGVAPDIPGRGGEEEAEEPDDAYEEYDDEGDRGERDERDDRDHEESAEAESDEESDEKPRARKKAPAKKAAPKKAAAKKSTARKTAAQKSPAKKTAKKAPARAAAKTSARRATGARLPKEGGRDE